MSTPLFKHLFTPLQLRHLTVKNRIVSSAHADSLAEDGMPTEKTRRYYQEKVKGGVGVLMCFGSAGVHPTSPARDWNGVELFDDRVIPHLARFADTMHRYDVPVIAQITHRGRRGVHKTAPKSIIAWAKSPARARGTSAWASSRRRGLARGSGARSA